MGKVKEAAAKASVNDFELEEPTNTNNAPAQESTSETSVPVAEVKENIPVSYKNKLFPFKRKKVEQHKFDKIARVVFPLSFALTNIIYFVFHHAHEDTVT